MYSVYGIGIEATHPLDSFLIVNSSCYEVGENFMNCFAITSLTFLLDSRGRCKQIPARGRLSAAIKI